MKINKTKIKDLVRDYWIVGFLFSLFFYIKSCSPLCYDQLNGGLLYRDYGGFLNYITGFCTNWFLNINLNRRFVAAVVSGFLESNKIFVDIVTALLMSAIVGISLRIFSVKRNLAATAFAGALFLLVGVGIKLEVYMYASILFMVPVLLYLGIVMILSDKVLLDRTALSSKKGERGFVKDKSDSEVLMDKKTTICYYGLLSLCSLWLETPSMGVAVTMSILLLYYCIFKKKDKLALKTLLISWVVSVICLFIMFGGRGGNINYSSSFTLQEALERIIIRGVQVMGSIFDFDGARAIICLLCAFSFIVILKAKCKNKKILPFKIAYLLFQGCWAALFALLTYNQVVANMKATPDRGHLLDNTILPILEMPVLGIPSNDVIKLIFYIAIIVSFLVPILLSKRKLVLLLLYCASVSVLFALFIGVEGHGQFGYRITSFSIFLLCVICFGLFLDAFYSQPEPQTSEWKLKLLTVAAMFLLFIPSEQMVLDYQKVNEVRIINYRLIEKAQIRQIEGDWNFETDMLTLVYYPGGKLFAANIGMTDPHYPFYLRVYKLHPDTVVDYTASYW